MMNKKCISILEEHNYKVIPEMNFIESDSLGDMANIVYDDVQNEFGILVMPIQVYGDENINGYTKEIASITNLVAELNYYAKRGDSDVCN